MEKKDFYHVFNKNDIFFLKMTHFTKNNVFHDYFVFLQHYDSVNHSDDFCPVLSRSQNIVPRDHILSQKPTSETGKKIDKNRHQKLT